MKAAAAKTAVGFRNILFATDFSAAAANAIPYVKRIAKHYEANLVVLHVHPSAVNPMTPPETWAADAAEEEARDQRHREELLNIFAGVPTQVRIEEGGIQSSLQTAIEKNNIDLVVIGTRGRTGFGKLLLGSVAEEILRTVTCPVLTVGHMPISRGDQTDKSARFSMPRISLQKRKLPPHMLFRWRRSFKRGWYSCM